MKFPFIRYCCIVLALCLSSFSAILLADNHTITVSAVGCSTEEKQSVPDGAVVTLTAVPSEGFHFVKWSDGNTANPRQVTVRSDIAYRVSFDADVIYRDVITIADAVGLESATGAGTYRRDTTIAISVTAADGYTFYGWSDGNTDNPRRVLVNGNAIYIPVFTSNIPTGTQFTVTYSADGCTAQSQQFAQGTVLTLKAVPTGDNLFVKWSDGNTANPRVVSVASDVTYQAIFGTVASAVDTTMYTLTVSADGCSAPLVKRVPDGATCELLAVPDATCGVFTQWSDGNTDNPRSVVVTGDATYTAEFTREQYTITTNADNAAHGTVSATTVE